MKSKSVRAATVALLSVLLSLSLIGIAIVVSGTGRAQAESAHFNYVKAADTIAVPPEPEAVCAFAHTDGASHTAYLVDSAAKLKWLFDNSRTEEELSRCYVLRLPSALDISSWADTGIGSSDVPFSGHFYGGDAAIKYAFTTSTAAKGAEGGMGLFPSILGTAAEPARVSGLTLDVTMTKTALPGAGGPGAVGDYADHAVIENITVRQSCPQTNRVTEQTGPYGSDPYLGANNVAGIVSQNRENSVIRDCSVTLLPQMRAGIVSPQANAIGYGGISSSNFGVIDRCNFYYQAGAGVMISSGGITVSNYGDITNCYVSIQDTGLALRATGGITDVHDNGAIRNCTVNIGNDSVFDNSGSYGLSAGIASFVGYNLKDTASLAAYLGNTEITGCTVVGTSLRTHGTTGGLVGEISMNGGYSTLIEDCSSSVGTITDTYAGSVGGLIGAINVKGDLVIRNCTASTNINTVASNVGGIVGLIRHSVTGSFTMENCHSYAASIVSSNKTAEQSWIGGAVGMVIGQEAMDPTSTQFKDCSASADITATDTLTAAVGGFVGMLKFLAEDAAGQTAIFTNCRAYGAIDNSAAGVGQGGFAGWIHKCKNLRIANSSAGGSLDIVGDTTPGTPAGIGGFIGRLEENENFSATDCYAEGSLLFADIGFQGGFVGHVASVDTALSAVLNVTFTRCHAYGDLSVKQDAGYVSQTGGFAGCIEASIRFENCSASGEISVYSRAGGFFGIMANLPAGGKADYIQCTASGDVYGNGDGYIGGFAGHVWNCDPTVRVTFDRCTAYGNARDRARTTSTSGYGGFIATVYNSNVYFVDCTAYGDAIGYTAGGFIAYVMGTVQLEFQRCTAYGDAIDRAPADGKNYNSQAGGFLGYAEAPGQPLTISNCKSYGNVEASTDDCGGFLGPFRMKATVTNCHSYARSVSGRTYSAGFAAVYTEGGKGSVFKGCTYTPANLSFFLFFGSGAEAVKDQFTKDAACKAGDTVYTDSTVPRTNVSCDVPALGSQINISFTGVKFLTDTVKELSVSIDGGKYYTQLVTGGKTLVAATVNGGALGIGGTISVTDGNSFSILYGTNAYPAKANIVVRIEFTKGYSKTYSWS